MALAETFDAAGYKQAQHADWQGAAAGWRTWYEVLEAGGSVVSHRLVELARIGPGDTALDVGTGYGEPALTAARAVAPTGRVLGADIAGGMLDFARERARGAGLANVEFREADAEHLVCDDESFDAVLSRQGLQFLADVPGALRRFHRFLRPGGRIACAVWGSPGTVQFAFPVPLILEELHLPAPPAGRPGIFALADGDRLARLASAAGFRDVKVGTVTAVYETASAQQMTRWLRDVAPPIVKLLDGQPDDVQARIWQKVTEAWEPLTTAGGGVRTENQAIWLAGTK
jgi:ubiquinone/menaquinone biosynthesis C-methylase UbiE